MAQFPLSDLLTGVRRIFVSIMALKDDGTSEIMAIDNNGGIKTALVTELPPGTNNIGSVEVNSIPEVAVKNNAAGTPIKTTNTGNATTAFVFQQSSGTTGVGNVFTVGSYKTLTIEVYGTSTSQTVVFQGIGPSGAAYPIMGTKMNDGTTGSQTSTLGQIWQFNIAGLTSFRVNLTTVSGGQVTVSGTAIA